MDLQKLINLSEMYIRDTGICMQSGCSGANF